LQTLFGAAGSPQGSTKNPAAELICDLKMVAAEAVGRNTGPGRSVLHNARTSVRLQPNA
jgi:hypothetical protein